VGRRAFVKKLQGHLRHSPTYALLLVVLLVVVQARAFFEQWQLGFRPFQAAPQRVALSWDMFAIEIERCGVSWDPPSFWRGKPLKALRDLAAPIEWDPVYNRKEDYLTAASIACGERAPGQLTSSAGFKVHCFAAHGEETQDESACPPAR
jgi:hypothetical protein